jgi:hypothetical protein
MEKILEKIKAIMDNALWMDLPLIEKDILDLIESEKQAYAKQMCKKALIDAIHYNKSWDTFEKENFPEPKQEQNG